MDFHFLVMEKSWKILFGKEWSPWKYYEARKLGKFDVTVTQIFEMFIDVVIVETSNYSYVDFVYANWCRCLLDWLSEWVSIV